MREQLIIAYFGCMNCTAFSIGIPWSCPASTVASHEHPRDSILLEVGGGGEGPRAHPDDDRSDDGDTKREACALSGAWLGAAALLLLSPSAPPELHHFLRDHHQQGREPPRIAAPRPRPAE